MTRYTDQLRRLVEPAGPIEGADPVRVGRAYLALRNGILGTAPATLGLAPTTRRPRVWAVLVDLSVAPDQATVVGVADGTTSLYTGAGGGIFGAGSVSAVARATDALLDVAEARFDDLPPVDDLSLPAAGRVAFLVLGYEEIRGLAVPEADAQSGTGVIHELYIAVDEVVTQLRVAGSGEDPR